MQMPGEMNLSSEVFRYWVIDRTKKQIRIYLQNGKAIIGPIAGDEPILESEIAMTVFDWENWWVENLTKRGHMVIAEAYSPFTEDPLHGRPVVYLDQNHWSTVAQALTDPSRILRKSEIAPALELARLANDGGIVVPLSSAHLRETAPLDGDRRYEVGVAMAGLSGGWQMRHPTDVWRSEVTRLVAAELGLAIPSRASLPVFTLEPHAVLDDDTNAHQMDPKSQELFMLAHTSPSVMLELLLDPDSRGSVSPPGWVDRNQVFTDALIASALTKGQKRKAAYMFAWTDNGQPVHLALEALGIGLPALAHLTDKDVPGLLSSQPMLGYFSSLFVQRHVSASTKWKDNDLTDLMFLACATGYADYVAAEKQTGTELQQLQASRGERRSVFPSLEALVDALKTDDVKSASEREGAANDS